MVLLRLIFTICYNLSFLRYIYYLTKVMEAMPRFQSDSPSAHEVAAAGNADDDGTHADSGDDTILRYAMSGHSGDSSCIPFVRYGRPPRNEKDVFAALQVCMHPRPLL